MRILVDADACPVVDIAIEVSKERNIEIILFYDDSHQTYKEYAKIVMVPKGRDAVDYALINSCQKNDIVITQDYGLASIVLSKNAVALNQNGMIYNDNNIDLLLLSRANNMKARNSKRKNHLKGPRKRTIQDDILFKEILIKMVEKYNDK